MSDSGWPHRQQPTRLPWPWDSPGKNTGVGCHFLLQCMKVKKWKWSRSVVSDSSRPHGLQPTRLLHPWDSPGKSTGVGCHCTNGWQKLCGYLKFGLKVIYLNRRQISVSCHSVNLKEKGLQDMVYIEFLPPTFAFSPNKPLVSW